MPRAESRRRGRRRATAALLALGLVLPGWPAAAAIEAPDCPRAQALCLEAERDGGIDMKTGTAYLEGNVVGLLKQHNLRFRSELLRAYRNEADVWTRLELEQEVELEQPGRRATGEFAVIENASGEAELEGDAVLEEPYIRVEGEKVQLQREPSLSIVTGTDVRRAWMRYDGQVPSGEYDPAAPAAPTPEPLAAGDWAAAPARPEAATEPADAGERPPGWAPRRSAPTTEGEPPPGATPPDSVTAGERMLPDTLIVQADRTELHESLGEARFRGNVEMHRLEMGWNLWGDRVDLRFTEDRRLIAFSADGNVRIEQPGRVLTADHAESRNEMETLLLTGDARAVQSGQFDLNSERIEVYTRVEQGLVQSGDRQRPIRLTLELGGESAHRLTAAGIAALRDRGLPETTLDKLDPLVGQTYENRKAFVEALGPRLSGAEAELYQDIIVEAAR